MERGVIGMRRIVGRLVREGVIMGCSMVYLGGGGSWKFKDFGVSPQGPCATAKARLDIGGWILEIVQVLASHASREGIHHVSPVMQDWLPTDMLTSTSPVSPLFSSPRGRTLPASPHDITSPDSMRRGRPYLPKPPRHDIRRPLIHRRR